MSALFHVIEDAQVVLVRKNGVFQQVKLFERGEHLYAGQGSGFIRLYTKGGTSAPGVRWDHIEADITLGTDGLGRLTRRVA